MATAFRSSSTAPGKSRSPLTNPGAPPAAHPPRLAPPTLLTWQSHASRARAARATGGCTTSVGPTILQRLLAEEQAEHAPDLVGAPLHGRPVTHAQDIAARCAAEVAEGLERGRV